jgi:D-alanyl-D-alanine carboxypeptidase (penicillin-binding protein 5/6)
VRRILSRLSFIVVFAAPWTVDAAVLVPAAPDIKASAYVVQDFNSGNVLIEANADETMEPASLTKMMTTYVILSELESGNITLKDPVRVSKKAWKMGGSKMFIEVGKDVSVEELLKGVIIQSGNDASVALAEYVAGDESAFADLMNQHAAELGMTRTQFANASGLPHSDHYTTARDMTTMGIALIRDFPEYYPWHAIREYKFNNINQFNRNRLLWHDDAVDGIKTGHTETAGYCLVASAERDGMRLVSTLMGSASEEARLNESKALLRYGFRFFETHRLYQAGEPITEVRVWKGETDSLPLGVERDLFVTVPRGQYQNLDARMEIDEKILAPVRPGEARGVVKVSLDSESIAELPLVSLSGVPEGSLWKRMKDYVRLLME